MGISSTQYKDIMYQYDQTRMKNQRKLDERYETLYKKFPELKEIHDHLVELSIRQARMEVLNPESAHLLYKDHPDETYFFLKYQIVVEKSSIQQMSRLLIF